MSWEAVRSPPGRGKFRKVKFGDGGGGFVPPLGRGKFRKVEAGNGGGGYVRGTDEERY